MPNAIDDPLSIARSLSPLVEQEAATSEEGGTLPPSLIDAFRASGLFALQIPRALGGFEADAETTLAGWQASTAAVREARCAEYRSLVEDLAREVEAALRTGRHDDR